MVVGHGRLGPTTTQLRTVSCESVWLRMCAVTQTQTQTQTHTHTQTPTQTHTQTQPQI